MHCTECGRGVLLFFRSVPLGLIASAVVACGLLVPCGTSAQALEATAIRREPPRNVISIAPLALVLGQAFAPEYERAISSSTSVVAALGYLRGAYDDGILGDPVDARYLRAEGKFRYYPDGYRLSQLLVGASVGVTSANGTDFDDRGRTQDYSVIAPSVGLEVGYSGLPRTARRPYWSVISGWKRVFWNGIPPVDLLTKYATLRLAVGYAF